MTAAVDENADAEETEEASEAAPLKVAPDKGKERSGAAVGIEDKTTTTLHSYPHHPHHHHHHRRRHHHRQYRSRPLHRRRPHRQTQQ